jgi:hypothetical protein
VKLFFLRSYLKLMNNFFLVNIRDYVVLERDGEDQLDLSCEK